VLFVLLANWMYKNTNHNKNFFKNVDKFVKGVPKELEIMCTGSSYAKFDIDFSALNCVTFNFGVFPQSLHYDLKILKQYKKNFSPGCRVIIVLAPLSFGFVDYEKNEKNYIYYKILNKKYILNYRFVTKIFHVWLPLLATPRLAKYICNDIPKFDMKLAPYIDREYTKNEAKKRKDGWCIQSKIHDLKSSKVSVDMIQIFETTRKILEEMITLSLDSEYKPIIVIPPVSRELYKYFSKEFLEKYLYQNIRLANKRKVPVLDYLSQEEFWEASYYSNSDFMNKNEVEDVNVGGGKLRCKTGSYKKPLSQYYLTTQD
jgi:hypothetical protein